LETEIQRSLFLIQATAPAILSEAPGTRLEPEPEAARDHVRFRGHSHGLDGGMDIACGAFEWARFEDSCHSCLHGQRVDDVQPRPPLNAAAQAGDASGLPFSTT
jgi:hypothetical protein